MKPVRNAEKNVFIFNSLDAEMYDEMYHFKSWYRYEVNIVQLKLQGFEFNFNKAVSWMNNWECEQHSPQYVIVRDSPGIYSIYFQSYYSIQYFRKFILKEEIYIIDVTEICGNIHDFEPLAEDKKTCRRISQRKFNCIIDYFDNYISSDRYEYKYQQNHSQYNMYNNGKINSFTYIVEKLSDHEERHLKKLIKECEKINKQNSNLISSGRFSVDIKYGSIGRYFMEHSYGD